MVGGILLNIRASETAGCDYCLTVGNGGGTGDKFTISDMGLCYSPSHEECGPCQKCWSAGTQDCIIDYCRDGQAGCYAAAAPREY